MKDNKPDTKKKDNIENRVSNSINYEIEDIAKYRKVLIKMIDERTDMLDIMNITHYQSSNYFYFFTCCFYQHFFFKCYDFVVPLHTPLLTKEGNNITINIFRSYSISHAIT